MRNDGGLMNSSYDFPATSSRNKKSLGIRGRLFLGFSFITLILIISIISTLVLIKDSQQFSTALIENELPTYNTLISLNNNIFQSQATVRAYLLTKQENFINEWKLSLKEIDAAQKKLDVLSVGWTIKTDLDQWNALRPILSQLRTAQEKVMTAQNKDTALQILKTETQPALNQVLNILIGPLNEFNVRHGGLFETQFQELNGEAKKNQINLYNLTLIEYIILIISVLMCIIITYITFRSIIKPINQFRAHSNRIASGDLRRYLNIEHTDEFGQLGHDLNQMTKSLADITKQISESCHHIMTTISEVKQSASAQSAGATEQAASVNEITASLEEIEKSSTQTKEKAKSLGEAANRTKAKGQSGIEAVEQSLSGMQSVRDKVQDIAQTILELSNKSQQVSEITSAVNTIAQQSKMLALNASIEAAKAGEAGKGFAVVAAEVKNLAEESEQSTVQIQKILEDIRTATEKAVMVTEEGTKGVDKGLLLVENTGEHVKSLGAMIHETLRATQQIEAAIRQESIGIGQITTSMNEINKVTNTFVESVNQTVEAIENLAHIVSNLKKHIDIYKI